MDVPCISVHRRKTLFLIKTDLRYTLHFLILVIAAVGIDITRKYLYPSHSSIAIVTEGMFSIAAVIMVFLLINKQGDRFVTQKKRFKRNGPSGS